MNIEDRIKDMDVAVPSRHQEILRARLLAHLGEKRMKRKSVTRWLVPVTGLAILTGIVIGGAQLQRDHNAPTTIAQRTLEPISMQHVFAQASAIADKQSKLKNDTVYYQKKIRYDYNSACQPYQEYTETYTNKQGATLKTVRRNMENKIIESNTNDVPGFTEQSYYFDQSALEKGFNNYDNVCPPTTYASKEDDADYQRHLEAIAKAFGYQSAVNGIGEKPQSAGGRIYLEDLSSGDTAKQAATLAKLQNINEWSVQQNVNLPKYFNDPVIILSYTAGPHISETLYFSQSNKSFRGMTIRDPLSGPFGYTDIILEQSSRALSDAK